MLRRSRYGVDGLVRLGAISHGSAVVVRFGLVGSDVVRRSGRDPVRSVAVCCGMFRRSSCVRAGFGWFGGPVSFGSHRVRLGKMW